MKYNGYYIRVIAYGKTGKVPYATYAKARKVFNSVVCAGNACELILYGRTDIGWHQIAHYGMEESNDI
jgi:hypothetical protein